MSSEKDTNVSQPFLDLIASCEKIVERFAEARGEVDRNLKICLNRMVEDVKTALISVRRINSFAHEYDFSPDLPGNGYRSFVTVASACIHNILELCRVLCKHNNITVSFYKSWYLRELNAYRKVLENINLCLRYLETVREWSEPGDLISARSHDLLELFIKEGFVNQFHIYGRCAGFQYCKSIRRNMVRMITIMTTLSESYYSQSNIIWTSIKTACKGVKYFLHPESRALRMTQLFTNIDITFCKAFFGLAEARILEKLPALLSASVEVNYSMNITPHPLLLRHLQSGHMIKIPIPISHIGPAPISVCLLSGNRRGGMIGSFGRSSVRPPSDNLIIHCHGGGFIASTRGSEEMYLRDWTNDLDTPILSVKYSLAPQAPCPRALEDIFYTYCWSLNHCELLGWTGKRIILHGDSAGATLALGVALKCIRVGVRIPDGLFLAYPSLRTSCIPSPSQLLSLLEATISLQFLVVAVDSYLCIATESSGMPKPEKLLERKTSLRKGLFNIHDDSSKEDQYNCLQDSNNKDMEKFTVKGSNDPLIAPYLAGDADLRMLPRTKIVSGELDVCLDDCVMYAKRMQRLNANVTLDIIKGLPHGFLNFAKTCKEIDEGVLFCKHRMRELLVENL